MVIFSPLSNMQKSTNNIDKSESRLCAQFLFDNNLFEIVVRNSFWIASRPLSWFIRMCVRKHPLYMPNPFLSYMIWTHITQFTTSSIVPIVEGSAAITCCEHNAGICLCEEYIGQDETSKSNYELVNLNGILVDMSPRVDCVFNRIKVVFKICLLDISKHLQQVAERNKKQVCWTHWKAHLQLWMPLLKWSLLYNEYSRNRSGCLMT